MIVQLSLYQTDFNGFASFVGIFRRKTNDEIAMDGEDYGTHKLLPIKTRYQGKDAAGHIDLVRNNHRRA